MLRDVASAAPPEVGKCHDHIFGVVLLIALADQLALDHAAQERAHADAFAPRGVPQRAVLLRGEVHLRPNHRMMFC